jgi:hypothetical protein
VLGVAFLMLGSSARFYPPRSHSRSACRRLFHAHAPWLELFTLGVSYGFCNFGCIYKITTGALTHESPFCGSMCLSSVDPEKSPRCTWSMKLLCFSGYILYNGTHAVASRGMSPLAPSMAQAEE